MDRHLAQLEIPEQLLSCLKTCLPNVWRHVHTMSTRMFEPCLRHVYTMLKHMFTPCFWKTWLYHIERCIYKIFDIFQSYLKTCLQLLRHLWVMFKGMKCHVWRQCWQTCFHKIDDICFNIFESILIKICSIFFKALENLIQIVDIFYLLIFL